MHSNNIWYHCFAVLIHSHFIVGVGGSSTGEVSSTLDAGCGHMRLRMRRRGRRSLTRAQGHYSACTRNRHSSPKMVVLSQKGLLQGSAHTPLWQWPGGPPSRWRRWRMDNPLARPRFDHFHSLFSPQPTSLAHSPSLSRAASRKTVSREDHFPEIQLLSSRILPPASDALLCFIGCDCDDVCDNRRLRDVRV